MNVLIIAVAVGAGLALLTMAFLQRARERDDDLYDILLLPFGEQDIPVEAVSESRTAILERGIAIAQSGLDRTNLSVTVAAQLERARLPLRPGEFVLIAAGSGVGLGAVTYALTGRALLGVLFALAGPWLAWGFVKRKVAKRRRAIEAQLPEAFSLIASSLQAGHTALRAVQAMVEESEPPLSEEFARVVAETRLGDPLVDALERLADRVGIPDLAWAVQAIRIQQTVGGKLADLLFTLAEFMRAREEIRREVRVLTAEGRLSAWALGALPVLLFVVIQVMQPGYIDPLLSGPGLVVLCGAGMSVAFGIRMILNMVKIKI